MTKRAAGMCDATSEATAVCQASESHVHVGGVKSATSVAIARRSRPPSMAAWMESSCPVETALHGGERDEDTEHDDRDLLHELAPRLNRVRLVNFHRGNDASFCLAPLDPDQPDMSSNNQPRRVRGPVESGISKRLCRQMSQSVCLWNVKFSRDATEPTFAARDVIAGKDARTLAEEVLSMDDEQFRTAFKKSPIKRAKRGPAECDCGARQRPARLRFRSLVHCDQAGS